jgi:hypothetical protein
MAVIRSAASRNRSKHGDGCGGWEKREESQKDVYDEQDEQDSGKKGPQWLGRWLPLFRGARRGAESAEKKTSRNCAILTDCRSDEARA